ncbi:MAG: hypothetical protein ACI379_02330 [Nocardioides sp.]|uniref:hypothetical protein n=1 Tax=Nocardioides sp. TaxID=35761 RepID=UPI003EFC3841
MKYVGLALGIVMLLGGGLVTLQANGVLDGPFSDGGSWGIIGALVAGLGVALVLTVVRPANR